MIDKLLRVGSRVKLNGWIKSVRRHKNIAFISINDGGPVDIQAVVDPAQLPTQNLYTGCAISLEGQVATSIGSGQREEIKVERVVKVSECDPLTYPFAKKYHSPEHLRQHLHLRMRTERMQQILRLNSAVLALLHEYFQTHGYVHINASIITNNDCEGGSEAFRLTGGNGESFFTKETEAFLTVSGQLQLEAACSSFAKVYTIGPCFRAERHNTTRHLAEFRMLECELAFVEDLDVLLDEVHNIISWIIQQCTEKSTSQRFIEWFSKPIPRLSYENAVQVLNKTGKFQPLQIGDKLATEHERFLAEAHFNGPYFCTHYPANQKPFYTKVCSGNEAEFTHSFDLVLPEFGELCGGSLREDDYHKLASRLAHLNSTRSLGWYLELRKYGSVPHGGFGIGFERLIQAMSDTRNIHDVLPFPVTRDLLKH